MDSSGHVKVLLLANPQPTISELKLNGRDLNPSLFSAYPLIEKTDGQYVGMLKSYFDF
jgi:hypothetical protein